MKRTVFTTSAFFTTSALVFLLGTSFAFPRTAAAQIASGDSLIAADIFKSAKPDDITVKKGLSIQSVGRRIGLKTLPDEQAQCARASTGIVGCSERWPLSDHLIWTEIYFAGFGSPSSSRTPRARSPAFTVAVTGCWDTVGAVPSREN